MPALTAIYAFTAAPVWTQDHLNLAPLDTLGDHLFDEREVSDSAVSRALVLLRSTSPVPTVTRLLAAHKTVAYYNDFYFRTHVIPNKLSLGNMLSTQIKEVEVWNAWPESRTLSSITMENAGGITLDEPIPAPTVLGQLEVRTYVVNVSTNGPPVIDATITFMFVGESPTLKITGKRVLVWPYVPQTKFREKLEWKTDLMQAYSAEQRLALRAAPRQSLTYDYQLDAEQYARAKALSYSWSHRVYGVAIWAESTRIGMVAQGAMSLAFDTSAADYRTGDLLLLWEDDLNLLAVEISTVVPGLITFTQPLERGFLQAYVMPLRFGRTLAGTDFSRGASDITQARLTFLVSNNKDLAVGYVSPFPKHRGVDVLTTRSVVLGDLDDKVVRRVDVFDNGSGPIETDPSSGYIERTETLTFDPITKAETWGVRRWLHSRRGRQKSFWVPSWNRDLVLDEPIGAGSTLLAVRPTGYPMHYGVTNIMILLTDGTMYFRRVLGGVDDASGSEILTLETGLPVAVPKTQVALICFIRHVRLDSDNIEMTHQYGRRVSITVPITEVPEGA